MAVDEILLQINTIFMITLNSILLPILISFCTDTMEMFYELGD